MRRHLNRIGHTTFLLSYALIVTGCATTSAPSDAAGKKEPSPKPEQPDGGFAPIEIERGPIGGIVRELGRQTHRSVVLMNGLEFYYAGPYSLGEMSAADAVKRTAADSGMVLHRERAFDFIHAPGFEALNDFRPSASLDRSLARIPVSIRLGADTPLYGALALLSHSYRVTLVADNVVASALCGETSLSDVALGDALDVILRSARLTDATCRVQSSGNTMLLYSTSSAQRAHLFAGASTTRPASLDKRVTLYLPEPPADPKNLLEKSGATPLANVLGALSKQLDVKVEADRRCQPLPVNPCVLVDVPIETALRLIIQQWPLPHYGYTATEDTIRFVYLGPPAD